MVNKTLLALTLPLFTLVSACSSSAPTAAQACGDYANAFCSRYSSCSNGFYVADQFGDTQTCVERYQSNCEDRLALPSAQSPTLTEACAQAIPSTSCDDLYANRLPADCRAPDGGLADGAVCTLNAQCQTTYCAVPKDGLCGICAPLPAAGDDCSSLPCGPGLICLRATMTCGTQSADGGICLDEGDCQYGYGCLDHFGDGGSCAPSGALGVSCDPQKLSGLACPLRLGLYCQWDGGVCAALGEADAGEPCGDVQGLQTACIQNGVCQRSTLDGGGVCLGYASDGTACDSDGGPRCLLFSRCVPDSDAGTAGSCQQPAAVACQ